jgi:hypothetical protein
LYASVSSRLPTLKNLLNWDSYEYTARIRSLSQQEKIMLGLFFVNISPDPRAEGRLLIKTGLVKSQVGADRYLLEFNGKGYNFSNVFRAEQLESFAFFNTPAARAAFIEELVSSNAPPTPAPVTEAPPAPAAAPESPETTAPSPAT